MCLKFNTRNIFVPAATALLFFALTGIILYKCTQTDPLPVFRDVCPGKILIIDAGHGGADGGAVAANGVRESLLNLSVAEKLNAAALLLGVQTVMTRESEELPYPEGADTVAKMKRWDQKRRLEIVNSQQNAVFISIHQNKYPDPRPNGPQVLYSPSEASKQLGERCHELLNGNLCPENRRLASEASKDIYLMANAECPAILVECGFISNAEELEKLQSENYQRKLALIVLASYFDFSNG